MADGAWGLRVGTCRPVSSYSKGEKLGEGTYGSVYQARDKATGRVVALKRVKEQSFEREGMPQTSLREVALLRRMQHPHIVRLIEVVVGHRADSVFLAFEYCAFDMARLVDTLPPFPPAEVKCVLSQLLGAVAHLHANAILHRDIKMSNLLLTRAGDLKLCDFGLAREHSAVAAGGEDSGGGGSGHGAYTPRVVTLWYRCPELLLGATTYGYAVDIWSVGCVFGELLLHRPLFPASAEVRLLELMCELLGTPSVRIWPGLAKLPLWPKLSSSLPENEYNELPSRFAKVSPSASTLELLNMMLTYDPERRISATDALEHRWLRLEHPPPAPTVASVAAIHREKRERPPHSSAADDEAAAAARKRAVRRPSAPPEAPTDAAPSGHASGAADTAAVARIPSPTDVTATTARQC